MTKSFLFQKKYAESIGILSKAELDRSTKEESDRITNRIKDLGPKGLKKKADELANAIAYNSRPVPDAMLTSVPIPSALNFKYFDVKSYRSGNTAGQPSGLDLDSWPIYAEAYDCSTNFVYVSTNNNRLARRLLTYQ